MSEERLFDNMTVEESLRKLTDLWSMAEWEATLKDLGYTQAEYEEWLAQQ
jgi:hypothetical protein